MYNYRLTYYIHEDGSVLYEFECFAEDAAHAKEQLFDAERNVVVYSIKKQPLLINKEAAEYIINFLQKIDDNGRRLYEMTHEDVLEAVASYNQQ